MSELPEGWESQSLRASVTKIVDGSHNPPAKSLSGLPMLSARNIDQGQITFDEYRLIEEEAFRLENRRTNISPGDVLLTIVGALGRSAVVPGDTPKFTLQRSVAVMRPKPAVDPHFLSYHFASPTFQEWINDNAKGTAQRGIYLKALGQYVLSYPPLAEQRRIVARLDALLGHASRARAELSHLPGLIERQKQAVLAQAFEQANLEAKQILSLGDLAIEVRNGLARRPENNPPGISILKISAIRSMTIRMDEKRYYVLEEKENVSAYTLVDGDLLFTRYNGNPELVANCGMIRQLNEVLIYPDKLIRVRLKRDVVAPQYIEAMASTPHIRGVLSPFIKSAAGQHGISGGDLKRLMFPVPSLPEQAEIVRRIESAFARIERAADEARRAVGLLDRLEQATLAQAFRGEL